MKLTKVDRVRIAVGKEKDRITGGRGILYPTPNDGNFSINIEDQIQKRVQHANNLYSVFHRSDLPRELEGHFVQLVKLAQDAKSGEDFYGKLMMYSGYEENAVVKSRGNQSQSNTESRPRFFNIYRCNYEAVGKSLKTEMELHVSERMTDTWQKKEFGNAAVAILQCICNGRNFKANIQKVKVQQSQTFADFFAACGECAQRDNGKPYVFSSSRLENNFSLLMKELVGQLDSQDIQTYQKEGRSSQETVLRKQIAWLKNVKQLENKKRDRVTKKDVVLETVDLSQFNYSFAQKERLQAITVRMRKSLKWGENKRIAILLMQGLARMDGRTLASVVTELEQSEPENLMGFIDAVNRDYYRFNIAKSVRNIDVKVQVFEDENNPEASRLRLSSANHPKRAALTQTLEKYATSQEQAYEVLYQIKKIIFDYFLPGETAEELFEVKKLWWFPSSGDLFFDYNFEEKDNSETSARAVSANLQELWERAGGNLSQGSIIKKRISYVNYGKYCNMLAPLREAEAGEDTAFLKYWITYVKDYVEKEYVARKGNLHREECYRTAMARRCWKSIIQFLCGKYIDMGKAVFHFAMPEDIRLAEGAETVYGEIREEYAEGISSFAYEAIKAEETLQRNIANATVTAVSNFSKAVLDVKKQQNSKKGEIEDILFLDDKQLRYFMKTSAKKQILRYYGGLSSISGKDEMDAHELVTELLEHLKGIRNENFHYGAGKQEPVSIKYTSMLWNNDIESYSQVSRKKYYTNNAAMFYKKDDIRQLVEKLYEKETFSQVYIPSFQNILKRNDLPEYVDTLTLGWNKEDKQQLLFEGAFYFLLKEIYYHVFIGDDNAADYFLNAVDTYVEEISQKKGPKDNLVRSGNDFKRYVDTIKKNTDGKLTFSRICQLIKREYNQQNANTDAGEVYAHFKMLLPLCVRRAFQQYITDNYSFLEKPDYHENENDWNYLDGVPIGGLIGRCKEETDVSFDRKYLWYTFAHFISPRALNFLIGDFKSYIQYREDVLRRAGYAGQLLNDKEREQEEAIVKQGVERAKKILQVLEFVRVVSGGVTNVFSDYYGESEKEDKAAKEEYAEYLEQYIDFGEVNGSSAYERLQNYCYYTLSDGSTIDIYTDNNNPKVLRNIELSRMYAGGDSVLRGYPKVTKQDIEQYYGGKDQVAQILAKGLCEDWREQKAVVDLQNLRTRITLNEITDIYTIVNEMLGYLVSAAYLRERDEMYLLLGFYYMALQAGDQWNEGMDTLDGKVAKGLVLYQVASIFDYGLPLLCRQKGGFTEKNGQVSKKIPAFYNQHKASMTYALALFEADKYSKKISAVRNYVDHFKYYVDHKKSILDLYSDYYTRFFGYSSKLTNAVLNTFLNILARKQITAQVETVKEGKNVKLKLIGDLTAEQFTYKLQGNRMAKLQGINENFLKSLQQVLEYKETN